jgi:hypothetical protein
MASVGPMSGTGQLETAPRAHQARALQSTGKYACCLRLQPSTVLGLFMSTHGRSLMQAKPSKVVETTEAMWGSGSEKFGKRSGVKARIVVPMCATDLLMQWIDQN